MADTPTEGKRVLDFDEDTAVADLRQSLVLALRTASQPIPDAALDWFAAWLRSDEARQIVAGRISQLVQDGVCVCGTCLAEEIPARLAESLEQRP